MSQFWLYCQLGLEHVLSWGAYDHILFLVALVATYTFAGWRRVLILVSVFTVGHTLALFLAAYGIVFVKSKWIEFLIPITIIVTAAYNIFTASNKEKHKKASLLYVTTGFFGIIHGLAFSYYFVRIIPDKESRFSPLLEFALGIEGAQIVIVLSVLILAFIFQNILNISKRDWILVTSAIVIGVILPILRDNYLAL